ncbi:hypothetical protein K469DRAFT_128156 [Zopfia rhizophila CBS 207.26]|uniref:Uncharacterized protein n=1 Tax=Zopfia rhizophila CBS 207.26 TaxID=1314779 RepID=A0A6A6EUP1_9PEZI|nr:hypothetical protein K469DRAFT_128156 [Zopfia rhizophila CBS 207.26]
MMSLVKLFPIAELTSSLIHFVLANNKYQRRLELRSTLVQGQVRSARYLLELVYIETWSERNTALLLHHIDT